MHAILLLALAAQTILAEPRKLVWFNEETLYGYYVTTKGYVGPDGPWHALAACHTRGQNHSCIPVWPTGSLDSAVPSVFAGGVYEGSKIVNATKGAGRVPDSLQYQWPNVRPNDGDSYLNNNVQLVWTGDADAAAASYGVVNASVREVSNWTSPYVDTTPLDDPYQQGVGYLGLGKMLGADAETQRERLGLPPSMLDQLVDDGAIGSRSWFMHMGGASLAQEPSLVLGGYERNRALGRVGEFEFDADWKIPRLFLIDVALGFESGHSPFDSAVGSVWGANKYKIGMHGEGSGAPAGSVMTTPDASLPYIYLPPGVCEAAAEHLPVKWNEMLGLYLWDESSRSRKLAIAPSYMSFVFFDRDAQNVTVKVPLALLYLSIDPYRKGVNESTMYWPCKPWSDEVDGGGPGSGLWPLGRAFLQAAFVGYNYDRPRFYLAQAPGPDHGQSVLLDDDTETIASNPADSFEKTWRSTWEEVDGGARSSGTVVAIVLGVTAGLLGMAGAVAFARWFFSARSRKGPVAADAGEADGFMGGKPEMEGSSVNTAVEAGPGLPHELPSPDSPVASPYSLMPSPYTPVPRAEVAGDSVVYELPAEDYHHTPRRDGDADKKPE